MCTKCIVAKFHAKSRRLYYLTSPQCTHRKRALYKSYVAKSKYRLYADTSHIHTYSCYFSCIVFWLEYDAKFILFVFVFLAATENLKGHQTLKHRFFFLLVFVGKFSDSLCVDWTTEHSYAWSCMKLFSCLQIINEIIYRHNHI